MRITARYLTEFSFKLLEVSFRESLSVTSLAISRKSRF
jgi:hypothetical protein